jgi:hypothetical protein
VLTEVAAQTDTTDTRVLPGKLFNDLPRRVVATVIDEDDLARPGIAGEDGSEAIVELG